MLPETRNKPIKPYRMIYLSGGRGVIFSRLEGGLIFSVSGALDRWGIVTPERSRTRRAWAGGAK